VNSIRALFAGQPVGSDIWVALACLFGILVIAYGFAIAKYRRKFN
jgi:ABC-2 type transport system permease protein